MRIELKPTGRRLAPRHVTHEQLAACPGEVRSRARRRRHRRGRRQVPRSCRPQLGKRSVRMPRAAAWVRARMNRISAAASGRDWPRPLRSIRSGCEAIARGRRLVGGRLEGWVTRRSRADIGTAQFRFCAQAAGAATDRGSRMRARLSRHGRLVLRPAHRSRGDPVAPCHLEPRPDARQHHEDGLPARPVRTRRCGSTSPTSTSCACRPCCTGTSIISSCCARSPAKACASTIRPPANG